MLEKTLLLFLSLQCQLTRERGGGKKADILGLSCH